MLTFIIDTPRSRKGNGAPFTVQARDMNEALDKVVAHLGAIWLRGEYSVRP